MKLKTLPLLIIIVVINTATAQSNFIFKDGFEFISKLNDTGITRAGEYPSGNNADCSSTNISAPQDCHTGRDATHNDSTDGHAGFSFTKLDASGTPLVDQSVDYTTTPWACVQDHVTGFVWEVKTATAGIHNQDNTYQWGGLTAIGIDHPNRQGTYYDPSWNELVQGSNSDSLCGFDNWRVPSVDELSGLMNLGTFFPAIDINYFPNSVTSEFLSSSPLADDDSKAWIIGLYGSHGSGIFRNSSYRVRLVRSPGL